MLMFPLALAGGVVLGCLVGGRVGLLSQLRFRALGLLAIALVVQVALGAIAPRYRWVFVDASDALVGVWLLANARAHRAALRMALGLVAAGWLCILVVIVANGGMPVSLAAAHEVGARVRPGVNAGNVAKHVDAGDKTRLAWLGDVIPVRAFSAVISIGDVVLGAGVLATVVVAMQPRRVERRCVAVAS
jgi:hypothetical protein